MESRNSELSPLPPPPGAVSALVHGFNAIAGNVVVILFPIVLDVFLWLGPRLKAGNLFAPLMELLPQIQAQAPAGQGKIIADLFTEFSNGFNLLSVFRTFPLGVFSLMSTSLATNSPLGVRPGVELSGSLVALGAILGLTVCGWLAGGLYFRTVAQVALSKEKTSGLFRALVHSLLLAGFWTVLFFLANLPLLIFLWLLTLLNGLVQSIIVFILVVPLSWVVLAIFFSFHGIFVSGENAFISVRNSVRMLRYGLPPLGLFAMLALVISQGMNMLWQIPPADSWMAGIGIVGHAFVSTSLLAASFIFYRDLNTWIESALQWLKAQKTTSSARA
jgi:hypothetical protein